ncbi:hypothetical protein A9Q97_06450 [Rhodospirillales bacterium 47_12_T64]|nr:hypothetical protein A9Q97_06450 [Rhodospirillales bacterium 47_12_T64]
MHWRNAQKDHEFFAILLYWTPASLTVGILHSWVSSAPFVFFHKDTLPNLLFPNKSFAELLTDTHFSLGWGIAALSVVHIGAVLKHHYLNKDLILIRILPFCRTRN